MNENQKIIDSFWDAVPDNTTWEDLNKGMDISFTYNNKKYTINTRLGNYYSMGIEGYRNRLHQKAITAVEEEDE